MSLLASSSILTTADVHRRVLNNGMVLLARESHASPTVSSMIWYRVGARNEDTGQTGRSHFLEHMLFKGTEKLGKGEIDLLTLKNGGNNNAFTSYDFTAYYFNFAADRWEKALEVEADRMVNTVFDPAEFESEKRVIIEELKTGLDQPWGLLMQELQATAYRRHPYGNPVVGWLQDLEATTREGMQAYYRRFYNPANATLVLVGDFDVEQALDRAEEAFGSIPAGSPSDPVQISEPEQLGEKRITLRWRSDVPRLAIAYHTPRVGHEDSFPLQVLSVILTEGKSSRFYQRLVDTDQSATFVGADYGEASDPTLFHIRCESRGDHEPAAIEASIFDELQSIAADGVSEHELERAKHQIEAHFVLSKERTLDQAILLGQIETLCGLGYVDTYLSRIAAVDSAQVADVCRRYLGEKNRTVAWMLQEDVQGDEN